MLTDSQEQASQFSFALLDDPLASDQGTYYELHNRKPNHAGRSEYTSISSKDSALGDETSLKVSSPWLRLNDIELIELVLQGEYYTWTIIMQS